RPARRPLHGAFAPEPPSRAGNVPPARPARGVPRRDPAPERHNGGDRAARLPQRRPQRALLQGGGRRLAAAPRRGRARGSPALARDDRRWRVHRLLAPHDLDPAARAGDSQARPGLQPRDPHGAAAVPAAAGGPGSRGRPAAAARGPEPRLDPLGRCGTRIPRRLLRRAVVLYRILAHATRAQLLLRRGSVGLLEPARPVALRVLADRFGPGDRTGTRDRCGARDRVCAPRPVVGQLDAGTATMKRRLARLFALGAIATRRLALQKPLGMGLLGLGAFLFIGALTIVRAAVRESALAPGQQPDRRRSVRAWIATTASAIVLALALVGGRAWWNTVDAA